MHKFVANCGAGSGNDIFTLRRTIERGELDRIKEVLTSLFANITLKADSFEQVFQAVIYLVFTLLGRFTLCEMHPYSGRIDCKVETKKYIYDSGVKNPQTPFLGAYIAQDGHFTMYVRTINLINNNAVTEYNSLQFL